MLNTDEHRLNRSKTRNAKDKTNADQGEKDTDQDGSKTISRKTRREISKPAIRSVKSVVGLSYFNRT
jgi:hypothetical protein